MKRNLTFLVFLFCTVITKAQDEIDTVFQEAIGFLINTQTDTTIEGVQYAGEWPVYMELTEPYFFIGRRQKARDSNCFNVSAIHNFLSEIYLRDPTLDSLKPVLARSMKEINTYSTETEFNFWKALPPLKDHRFFPKKGELPLVRRPTNFKVKPRLVQKMSNIANDADDTNQANQARFYFNEIFEENLPLASAKLFEEWTDQKRQNRNWFNYLFHTKKNSGAYLTWLAPEYNYGIWNPVYAYLSVLGIFLPTSSSYPKAYVPWIPWGANDVDPVVNANILNYLAISGQYYPTPANENSIRMIERMTQREMWSTGGVYYPNAYHLTYSIAKAFKNGVKELKPASLNALKQLNETQLDDGSFKSRYWVNHGDTIQSTAYALHALLDFKEAGLPVESQKIDKAVSFLLSVKQNCQKGVFWKGGVYFTGGTALRNILYWHSDAYTTALIAHSFQRYSSLKKIETSPVYLEK